MAQPSTLASPPVAAPSRLILQDPTKANEVRHPVLRLSRELQLSPTPAMDRATAQQVWQALQLTPDELITQRLQLLDAYTKQDSATANARAARSETAKLKARLNELQDTRWQHPAVYGAGAAFVGLAGLWLWERKKRLAVQPSVAHLAPGTRTHAAPSPVASFVSAPVPIERARSLTQADEPIIDPIATSISPEDLLSFVAPLEPSRPAFQRPDPWWRRWTGKSAAEPAWTKPMAQALAVPNRWHHESTVSQGAVSIAFGDSQDEVLGMEAPGDDFSASDTDVLRSRQPMRTKLSDVDEGMNQLLEIRLAVQAMVDLGQLPAAKKLLDNHIENVPHTSAWAYLVHLDLCSQIGQRDAFEDMRKRYRLQFNRLAPYWREAEVAIQTLDSYTRPLAELCAVWHSPHQARKLMATWLLGAQYARRQFQLPAYNDLLDLYDMLNGLGDLPPSAAFVPIQDEDFMPSTHVYL